MIAITITVITMIVVMMIAAAMTVIAELKQTPRRCCERLPGSITFLLTGDNDPKVGPMQTRKVAAQLQASAADSGTLILFLSQPASGYGNDMPLQRRISERSDVLSQLNVSFRPVNPR